jgi:hypothetical protein
MSSGALLLLLLAAPATPAAKAAPTAREFLEGLYAPYARRPSAPRPLDDRSLERSLTPELLKLVHEMEEGPAARGEARALTGDPFVNAREAEVSSLQVKVQELAPGKAVGTVTFRNRGKAARVTAELTRLKAGWRIADLAYDDGTRFSRLLKQAALDDRARYWVKGSPREFLEATYGGYARPREEGAPEPANRAPSQAFAPAVAAAMGAPYTAPATQSDPLINGSGYHPDSLRIEALKVDVKEHGFYRASARVAFTHLGTPRSFDLELVRFPEGWVIDDVHYGAGESLRAVLQVGKPAPPPERFEEFAERFRLAVVRGDAEAIAGMIEPTGLVVGGRPPIAREQVLAELKAHRGPLHRTLLSTVEERRKGPAELPAGYRSFQEFFKANPEATRWHADLGTFVLVRWHLGGPELDEPARMTGPGLMVVRDFAGRLWFRNFGDLD